MVDERPRLTPSEIEEELLRELEKLLRCMTLNL
jgi:hypothetical protein